MFASVIESLTRTVPQELQTKVLEVSRSCVDRERGRQNRERIMTATRANGNQAGVSNYGWTDSTDSADESTLIPVVIAEVIMQLWSRKMYRYVENLILTKAIAEEYLGHEQMPLVHVLDGNWEENEEEEEGRSMDWVIHDQNETIIQLVWETFNMKQHFDEVRSHRYWIRKTYDKLKNFLPELPLEIVDRHDLTKYAFSQAIGYTLKWVHGISHPIWRAACKLHVYNEPHHKEMWSERFKSERKRQRMETWFGGGSCSHFSMGNCLNQAGVLSRDFERQGFPMPFLLESLVDMAAVEWERKKGCREDISEAELVTFEEKYLQRYNKEQYEIIAEVTNSIRLSSR
ncbi:uncharacterized protein [Palaemon carinicauda]|uniref:uncharacterized protein n=1 Tax=Palaemon carinicauda TaxID=392227 RepID=UPI0035B6734D